jgi:elongation factor Ts
MAVTTEMIKQLREQTNAGVLDCKKALEQTDGDMAAAARILAEKGLAKAAKKADRVAADGRVEAYVHAGDKLGVLVEVACETDFVARTQDFKPQWVSRDDVPEAVVAEEKAAAIKQMEGENKPAAVMERIIQGKLDKFYQSNCLLEQAYIRDDSLTIQQLVTSAVAKLGENIVVRRFARLEIG